METVSPQEIESRVAARYVVFLILWFALLMSVLIFLGIMVIVPSQATPNPRLSNALLGIGITTVIASFPLKQQLTRKAIDNSDAAALQSAHITSLALCEAAAVLGILNHFATASNLSWYLFAIAIIGILLHFPRKDPLRAVSYKNIQG